MVRKKIGLSRGLGQFREEVKELVILPELEAFIPPLSKEEENLLEESIVKDGIREPLDVWLNEEQVVIVDGHNRYHIAKRLGLPFKTKQQKFGAINEVKEWMLRKQLGRRNLTDANRTFLIGLLYNNSKAGHGGSRKDEGKWQNVPLEKGNKKNRPKTEEVIANQTGTAPRTVRNAGQFVKGMELLTSELKKDVLSGKVKISKADIQKLAKSSPDKLVGTQDELKQIIGSDRENGGNAEKAANKKTTNSKLLDRSNENIADYCDRIIKIIQPKIIGEDKVNQILNQLLKKLVGESLEHASRNDLLKLTKSGYVIIRADDQPNIRIKKIDRENLSWVTLEKNFSSKKERDNRLKELLKKKRTIQG